MSSQGAGSDGGAVGLATPEGGGRGSASAQAPAVPPPSQSPAGGAAAGPSPAILKKVKKVLDTRIEAPELSVALKELSTFYGPNTLESRRNLRSSIERRGVQVSQNLVEVFGGVMQQLDKIDGDVAQLAVCTQRMQERIKAAHANTSQIVRITEQLQRKESESSAHQALITEFLGHFRLSQAEMQILQTEQVSDDFLRVLAKVGDIQAQCRQLLRVHHKTALMDLVDETSSLQETGYDRLYRWMQTQSSQLGSEEWEVTSLMRKGMTALRGRPALFKVCLEDLGSSRRQTMFKKFLAALTKGGPGGVPRPIEVHAHDPLRYVGDMLAWLHQALATERELLVALFLDQQAQDGAGAAGSSEQTGGGEEEMLLASVFTGVAGTLQARIDSVLSSQSSPVVTFKLGNLLLFYLHTIGAMLPEGAALTSSMQDCHKNAGRFFMEFLNVTAQRLYRQPPPVPSNLAPHPEVMSIIDQLSEILVSFESSLVPARVRENYFKPVVEEAVEPLLAGCALAANGVSPAEGSVYLANCCLAVQGVLQRYDFCQWRLPRLKEQLSTVLTQMINEQVESLLRSVNLDEKIYAVRSFADAKAKAEASGTPAPQDRMCDMPGMDPLALSIGVKQFYATVLGNGLEFKFVDRLSSHLLRQQSRERAAQGLAAVYKELSVAVSEEGSGYKDAGSILLHSVDQIESLLMAGV